jgi:hypothetical protein
MWVAALGDQPIASLDADVVGDALDRFAETAWCRASGASRAPVSNPSAASEVLLATMSRASLRSRARARSAVVVVLLLKTAPTGLAGTSC